MQGLKEKLDRRGRRYNPRRWRVITPAGHEIVDGKRKPLQRWSTFVGDRKEAEAHAAELMRQAGRGELVTPTRMTLSQFLAEWLAAAVEPHNRANTAKTYRAAVKHVDRAALGEMALQSIRATHLEAFYATKGLPPSMAAMVHTVLHRALRRATRDRLIASNPCTDVEHKPTGRRAGSIQAVRRNCWSLPEVAAFLRHVAAEAGTQTAALFTLAIDTGARRGEVLGLTWEHLDLDAGHARIEQQLLRGGATPTIGPPKGRSRTVTISAATVERLRTLRREQRELKLKNGPAFVDSGFVFSMQLGDLVKATDKIGHPLRTSAVDARFAKAIKDAQVPSITFHGLRHSSATALLANGVPAHAVAKRLGHSTPMITLKIYAHVTEAMEAAAADVMGRVITG